MKKLRILMVCLGNICRSPLAEGVLRKLIKEKGLEQRVEVDSAGTAAYHIGKDPDHRSQKVAIKYGFKLEHKGRQLIGADFKNFDFILVMDHENLENSLRLASTAEEKAKVKLITEYDPRIEKLSIVPDPYWGTMEEFELIHNQLVQCCEGLLRFLSQEVDRHEKSNPD